MLYGVNIMNPMASRRQFLGSLGAGIPAILGASDFLRATDETFVETATIADGDLHAVLRDNSNSPKILSGLDSLFHLRDAPDFDAFDPDSKGASAGLNFEHIICGHKNEHNAFTPRRGKFPLSISTDGKSGTLIRNQLDDPWKMSSTMKYTVTAPHYIDLDFRCVPHDRSLFGERGYAVLFFANYMNDVENVGLNFRGIDGPNQPDNWINADAPPGHHDWNQGGTYRSSMATDLSYDADLNFKLNTWSYDYPRFTQPFYYGRAARGMVLMLMFNKIYTEEDEIRFSLFKFKLPRFPRPAWDFQYVIRGIQESKEYGFKARLVWKRFVSQEDCVNEFESWTDRWAK
jgi:hypothetical protein